MSSFRRRILTTAGLAATLLAAAVVWAQSEGDVVLHEYFNPWDVDISAAGTAAPGSSAEPATAQTKRAPGEPPGLSVNPGTDELIFGSDGPVDPGSTSTPYGPLDPRQQSSKLDDRTDRVDQLNYYANFEPSVVPYKRVVVQNKAKYNGGDYELALDAGSYRRVAVERGSAKSGEDTFWGSFLIRAQKGQRHPLPSVAPDQRILEVQSEPDATVRFERDAADNWYIVPGADGLLRLNIKIAAPKSYFNGAFDASTKWSQFRSSRTPALPSQVQTQAKAVLGSLGVSRQMSPRNALLNLIEHYRNFEGKAFPEELKGKDLYASLSREQVGVCRHRSLAFLISAKALGIPTRYIYNEAHAFVEVHWPGVGWRRVDLGGAAEELNYSGNSGGNVHSAGQDTLPQPPNYQNELERLRERGGEVGESEASQEEATSSEANASDGQGQGEQAAQQMAAEGQQAQDGEQAHQVEGSLAESSSATGQPEASRGDQDKRAKVIIDVEADTSAVFRGNELGLTGSMFTEQGLPLAKKSIKVFLGPVGSKSSDTLIELGTVRTDGGGRFHGKLSIPDSVSIGRWSVILRFPGDDEYQPARVE